MRLFLSQDGKTGFALKGADIVSAFKHVDSEAKLAANGMLALAVQQGGRKLDAFDTVLPTIYARNGFVAASRLDWNDEHKPEAWQYETYKEFNDGRPDVVFMVYDPERAARQGWSYSKTDGVRAESYEQAVALQQAMMRPQDKPLEPPAPSPSAMSHDAIAAAVDKVSKALDYDRGVFISNGAPHKFELNGKQYEAAGVAHTSNLQAPSPITVYARNIRPDFVEGLIAHEIEHVKFESALNRYREDLKKIVAEPRQEGPGDDVMRPDGSLKPPYDEKYPAYTLMHEAFFKPSHDDFEASDGVTEYSYDWWRNWKDKGGREGSGHSAMHETLAEMAKIKYKTGKFPAPEDYYGHRLISWRTPPGGNAMTDAKPKPSAAQQEQNAKRWRNLYRAIDKVWKLPPGTAKGLRATLAREQRWQTVRAQAEATLARLAVS